MGSLLNTVVIHQDDELKELFGIENTETSSSNEDNYALWMLKGKDYIPAPDVKIANKLPNGIYKVIWEDDTWKIINVPSNTDELYSFSENFTETILKETEAFWSKKDLYDKYKLTYKRGMLLCGAPGTGKTSLISLLIQQLIEKEGIVFLVNGIEDFNSLSMVIKPIIRRIEPNRPIITIIEDVDQLIEDLHGDAKLLDFLDGQNSIDNHLIILTSNNTTGLSEALLRPSRIDLVYEIPMPNSTIRKEYFQKKGVKEEEIDEFVQKTDNMSFAELKEVFIGTYVMGKQLDDVIQQVETPFEYKDYLNKEQEMKGLI